MAAWARYALAAAWIMVLLALAVIGVVPGTQPAAVWLAAGVGYVVQLAAFGVLLAGRDRAMRFLVGWGGGMALRFVALAGMAIWVTISDVHHPETALMSLIGFMLVLVLIEPLFLRMAD